MEGFTRVGLRMTAAMPCPTRTPEIYDVRNHPLDNAHELAPRTHELPKQHGPDCNAQCAYCKVPCEGHPAEVKTPSSEPSKLNGTQAPTPSPLHETLTSSS